MKFSDQRPEVDGRPDAGLRGPGRKHQDLEHHLEAGVKKGRFKVCMHIRASMVSLTGQISKTGQNAKDRSNDRS